MVKRVIRSQPRSAAFAFLMTTAVTPRVAAADAPAATGTGIILGSVTNKTTGKRLIGAASRFPCSSHYASSTATGRLSLLNVPPARHTTGRDLYLA